MAASYFSSLHPLLSHQSRIPCVQCLQTHCSCTGTDLLPPQASPFTRSPIHVYSSKLWPSKVFLHQDRQMALKSIPSLLWVSLIPASLMAALATPPSMGRTGTRACRRLPRMVLPEPFADFFQNSSSNRHLEKLQVLLKDQGHLSTLIVVILLGHIDSIFPGKRCRRELGKHKVSTQITGEKLLEEPKRSLPSARGSQTFFACTTHGSSLPSHIILAPSLSAEGVAVMC